MTVPADDGPLNPQHQQALADARRRMGKLRAALGVATFNIWSTAIVAAGSLLVAIFDYSALLAVIVLAVVTANEWRGRARLRNLDDAGLRLLALNQLGFMVVIILYSVWRVLAAVYGPNPYAEQMQATPEIGEMLGDIGALHVTITCAIYLSLIVATVIFQGGCALYYHLRRRSLRDYLRDTPEWITDLQRAGTV